MKIETEMLFNIVKIATQQETKIVFNIAIEDATFLLKNVLTDKKFKYAIQPV